MASDIRGWHLELLNGWAITVNAWDGESVAWLTNRGLDSGVYESTIAGDLLTDLEALGYVLSVYHEEIEAPPLVTFHAARRTLPAYVWEPASGRFYQAGGGRHA
jgi:hypothetical protein